MWKNVVHSQDEERARSIADAGIQGEKRRYFFLNEELHYILRINRSRDMVMTYNFQQRRRMVYVWSEFQRKCQNAFSIGEAAVLVGRSVDSMYRYIKEGVVDFKWSHALTGKTKGENLYRFFSEDHVIELWEHLCNVHQGRPRKDGWITSYNLPTREELNYMMRTQEILYREDDDGNIVPVWKA